MLQEKEVYVNFHDNFSQFTSESSRSCSQFTSESSRSCITFRNDKEFYLRVKFFVFLKVYFCITLSIDLEIILVGSFLLLRRSIID